jgi:hypothetical protein
MPTSSKRTVWRTIALDQRRLDPEGRGVSGAGDIDRAEHAIVIEITMFNTTVVKIDPTIWPLGLYGMPRY